MLNGLACISLQPRLRTCSEAHTLTPTQLRVHTYGHTQAHSHTHTCVCAQCLGSCLNLAPHLAGAYAASARTLHTACDVEVRRSVNGRLYVLDTHRVFPPEAPGDTPHLVPARNSIFFRMLRPDFARAWKVCAWIRVCTCVCVCGHVYVCESERACECFVSVCVCDCVICLCVCKCLLTFSATCTRTCMSCHPSHLVLTVFLLCMFPRI